MSVTIRPCQPNGRPFPYELVRKPCEACAEGYCDGRWCEDGIAVEREPTAPEANWATANAVPLLATVGLDPGPCFTGEIGPDEVAGILAECEAALAVDAEGMFRRAPLLRAEEHHSGHGSATMIVCGSDDHSARRRLVALQGVLRWALEHGAGVAWE